MGGRASKRKGRDFERATNQDLQDAGIASELVPMSGQLGGKHCADLSIPLLNKDRRAELKIRKRGSFAVLYKWLEGTGVDFLILRANGKPRMVVVPWTLALEVALTAERAK